MVRSTEAFVRVLSNLSKAVLKRHCIFNVLPPYSEDLGYTYIEKNIRGKEPIAQIFINPMHQMFSGLSEIEKYMFAFGVAVHEMLHQKFTNFDYFEKLLRKTTPNLHPLFQMIDNIFEDSRIEFFGNQVFGGWALKCLKFAIQKTWEMSSEIKDSDPLGEVVAALIQYGDTGKIKGDFTTQEARDAFCYVVENYFEPAVHNPVGSESIDLSLEATKYLCKQFPNSRAVNPPPRHQTRGKGENAKGQAQGSADSQQKQNNRNKTLQSVKNSGQQNSQKGSSQNGQQSGQQSSNGSQSQSSGSDSSQSNSQSTNTSASASSGSNSAKNSQSSSSGSVNNSGRGVEGTDDTPSEIIEVPENSSAQSPAPFGNDGSENGNNTANGQKTEPGEENADKATTGESSSDESGDEQAEDNPNSSQGNSGENNGSSDNGNDENEEDLDAEFEAAAAKLAEQLGKAAEQIESEVKMQERETETLGITNDPEADRAYITRVQTTDREVDAYNLFDNRFGLTEQGEELAAELATIFRSKNEGWERSTRGRLNLERYLDPNFNSPFVFDKKLSKANDVAVTMLVDNSGSMSSRNRIDEVRKMAAVCAEAFNTLGVPFAVYGHDGSGDSVKFDIYKDFDDEQWYNIVCMEDGNFNYDGPSIRIASDYLKKRDEANKVLIVMSDGLSHHVPNAELAIREAGQFATVCGVALATSECEAIQQMYGENFIICERMDELNEKLTEKLKELSVNW